MKLTLDQFWAKTDENGIPCLSVRDHCLNVGAVGEILINALPATLRRLLPKSSNTLIALHDIGKISPGFQIKCPIWRNQYKDKLNILAPDQYESKHAIVSHAVLQRYYKKASFSLVSVSGHHGVYPTHRSKIRLNHDTSGNRNIPEWCQSAQEILIKELVQYFGELEEDSIKKGSEIHLFTGLMIFSDWIGSSIEWFPLDDKEMLTFKRAKTRAQRAVDSLGWANRSIQKHLSFEDLFKTDSGETFSPRPLQEELINASDAPGLYIVEAPMGCGKTEAALAASYKRWNEGDESGLYFALPTQLTSNRIHDRVLRFLQNVVSDKTNLARVHGSAWLMGDRVSPIYPASSDVAEEAAESNRWFSDSRKALLAPFGAGTIDQALMATMATRFSALRLFALSCKVIVIDEVHSYDPYTSVLVDEAVKWLLKSGCTVYILSATLTKARRASLVKAAGAFEETVSSSYPLITKVSTGSSKAESISVIDSDISETSVTIKNLSLDSDEWIERAAHAAENGACVLIVRNTIALAQETYHQLKSKCSSAVEAFGLIHSRFPLNRRNENEETWMNRLGKNSDQRPNGAILIGTQVVEQSVDIDADLLMTDLAPTDLILQRIGRLHRHQRNRPKGYENPICCILQPTIDWSKDAREIKKSLASIVRVYPPFTLFQAQRIWEKLNSVTLPTSIRDLLESSSSIPESLPDGAQDLLDEQIAETRKMVAKADAQNVFSYNPTTKDEEGTRWGNQKSAYFILLKKAPVDQGQQTTVEFFNGETCTFTRGLFSFELAKLLNTNAIRVPAYFLPKQSFLPESFSWLHRHLPMSTLYVRPSDSIQCEPIFTTNQDAYSFSYHPDTGLSHTRIESCPVDTEEDEFWF